MSDVRQRTAEDPDGHLVRIRSCRALLRALNLRTVREAAGSPRVAFRLPGSLLAVAMPKTQISRFQIHDELTAPEGSLPVIKGASSSAGQLPNFLGVLAGSPAALRGYTRFRGELRHGTLPVATLERIGLAVAEHYRSVPGITMHQRTARQAGVGIDEVGLAREWESREPREAALLRYLRSVLNQRGAVPHHLHEEAIEAGWSEEQLLEAIAVLSLECFTAMVNVAGEVPVDGSVEETRVLKAA
jgi:alkylhydroperoxidase family enzyme